MMLLLPAFPAAAASGGSTDVQQFGQIGDVRSPDGLSLPLTILLYVGIPLLGFIIGGVMAFRPSKNDRRRYRPGRPWTYEPVWFGDKSGLELEPLRAALPGAGGASGRW